MDDHRARAAHCRATAEEIRLRSETLKNNTAREVLLRLAEDYERMADTYEELHTIKVSD